MVYGSPVSGWRYYRGEPAHLATDSGAQADGRPPSGDAPERLERDAIGNQRCYVRMVKGCGDLNDADTHYRKLGGDASHHIKELA